MGNFFGIIEYKLFLKNAGKKSEKAMKKNIVINKAFSWNGSDWKIGSVEFDENYRSSAVLNLCRRITAGIRESTGKINDDN